MIHPVYVKRHAGLTKPRLGYCLFHWVYARSTGMGKKRVKARVSPAVNLPSEQDKNLMRMRAVRTVAEEMGVSVSVFCVSAVCRSFFFFRCLLAAGVCSMQGFGVVHTWSLLLAHVARWVITFSYFRTLLDKALKLMYRRPASFLIRYGFPLTPLNRLVKAATLL